MKRLLHIDNLHGTSKLLQYMPETILVHRVKCLSEMNKNQRIDPGFAPSTSAVSVCCATTGAEPALALWEDLVQKLVDCFANAAKRFGLTISLKKTEVMLQPRPGSSPPQPDVFVNDDPLNVIDKFCYLGSVLSQNAEINDITRRISAASAAFGRLESRLWKERGVRLSTTVTVYTKL